MGLLWPFTYTRNKKDIPQCYIINFRKEDYFLLLLYKKLICLRFLETYLIIRLNIVLNLKKNTSFFDGKLGDVVEGETRRILVQL